MMRLAVLVLALALGWSDLARAGDEAACGSAVALAERTLPLPPRALNAIATVESGRRIGNRVVAWPWSINAGGVGRHFDSKAEAIAAVQALQSSGVQSIDVGCMQINLAAHPHAFASLEDAFDPAANAAYAARFVMSLFQQMGRWPLAMTAYHSQTPEFAAAYARRLLAIWPEGDAVGLRAGLAPLLQREPSGPKRKAASALAEREPTDKAGLGRPAYPSSLTVVSVRGSAWPTERRPAAAATISPSYRIR